MLQKLRFNKIAGVVVFLLTSCNSSVEDGKFAGLESSLSTVDQHWNRNSTIYVVNDLDCSDCVNEISSRIAGSKKKDLRCLYYIIDSTSNKSQNFEIMKKTGITLQYFDNIDLIECLSKLEGGMSGPYAIFIKDGKVEGAEHVSYLK